MVGAMNVLPSTMTSAIFDVPVMDVTSSRLAGLMYVYPTGMLISFHSDLLSVTLTTRSAFFPSTSGIPLTVPSVVTLIQSGPDVLLKV